MFDTVRNNQRVVQIFLGLITLPFAFFGIEAYVRNSGAGDDLATVGKTKITTLQFEQAWRERQDQMRQALGANYRPEMFNTPEARLSVLNALVDQRLLLLEADKSRITASDGMLREVISSIPTLQENGKFSMDRYESALRAQGMSQPQFEARLRQDLTLQQLAGAVGDTAFVSAAQTDAMLRLQMETRQFGEFRLTSGQFADKVKIDAANVRKFYEENTAKFEIPEQVKAEYVVLSLETLLSQTAVSEAEVKAWYESHKDRYQQAEERRASHILILSGGEAGKEKARAKAEEILKEVKRAPARFSEFAKQHSQDPGSAPKGGDLGFFARGMMVKPFEEAVFSQKEGDLSGIVESEFGYHIIKLTGIKGGKLRPLESVRGEIETELKRQAASRKFAEAAELFNNMVYEQADSLGPVAEKFSLKTQKSGWLPKTPDPATMAALGPLSNAKLLSALFTEDAVKNKRNTEAVEVAQNMLVAARVLEHMPASVRSFESVKADIEKSLKVREAARLAREAGEEKLAQLHKEGDGKQAWSAVKSVSRLQSGQLPVTAAKAIFSAEAGKLPAYAGASVGNDYALYKIVKVSSPEKIDEAQRRAFQAEYGRIMAQEDLSSYLAALRQRYKVVLNTAALETKER